MLAVAAVLPLPAAATASREAVLVAGPVTVGDYELTLTTLHIGSGDDTTGRLEFVRRQEGWTQRQSWSVNRVRLRTSHDLRTGRLTGKLGRFGTVDLRFKATRRARRHRTSIPTCSGTDRRRQGTLTGRLTFTPDGSYFGTVRATRFKGRLTDQNRVGCTGLRPRPSGLDLTAQGTAAGEDAIAGWFQPKGKPVSTVIMIGGREVFRSLEGPGTLTVAPDLTSATAGGTGPFLTGSLSYAGRPAPDGGEGTEGTASGDLTARFDGIAPIPLDSFSTVGLIDFER